MRATTQWTRLPIEVRRPSWKVLFTWVTPTKNLWMRARAPTHINSGKGAIITFPPLLLPLADMPNNLFRRHINLCWKATQLPLPTSLWGSSGLASGNSNYLSMRELVQWLNYKRVQRTQTIDWMRNGTPVWTRVYTMPSLIKWSSTSTKSSPKISSPTSNTTISSKTHLTR